MKSLILGLAILVAGATASYADITCWYNAKGAKYGADDANPAFPRGVLKKGNGGDYSWGLTIDGGPADCPANLAAARKAAKH